MGLRAVSVALAAVVATAGPAAAWVPEKTPKRRLEAEVRRTLAMAPVRGSLPGIIVLRGGRPVVSIDAARPMLPASLMKLATTTAALEAFGADHRFATRVLAPRRARTVTALYLVGGGDPTLATAAYRRAKFLPSPGDPAPVPVFASGSPTLEQLAARVRKSGVRRVAGPLIVDASLFDGTRTAPGWIPRYLAKDPDIAYLAGLTVNQGYADLENERLLGSPPAGAGGALKAALAARGIVVAGPVVAGRAPARAVEVARVLSPPLREIVFYINRWSVNYPAEMLLKALGARFGGQGSTAAGAAVVRRTLAKIGIPLEGFRMADGSGLSLLDRASPRTIGAILQHALTREGPVGEALRDSLPVAGGPGTLFRRMTGWPTRGNLRGKTGLIRNVRAMAGWVTGADGVPLVYVAMFNGARSAGALTRPLDLLGLSLALFPLV